MCNPGLIPSNSPASAAYAVLKTLNIPRRALHNTRGLDNARLCFSIESPRDLQIMECLFPAVGGIPAPDMKIGDPYLVVCENDEPVGIEYDKQLVWLSEKPSPKNVPQARRLQTLCWPFDGLRLFPGVYGPSRDFSEQVILNTCKTALDLGCGSGALSVKAAKLGIQCTASDINPIALENTAYNAAISNVKVETVESNIFENLSGRRFDTIFCFPPEPEESNRIELKYRSVKDPTGCMVRDVIANAADHLRPGGTLQLLLIEEIVNNPLLFKLGDSSILHKPELVGLENMCFEQISLFPPDVITAYNIFYYFVCFRKPEH